MRAFAFSLVAAVATLVAACGGSSSGGKGGPCEAGQVEPCSCLAGRDGTMSCGADGRFEACECGGGVGGSAGAGGAAGAGGGAGAGGSVSTAAADKVDLLVVVDNSPSMADKAEILRSVVPDLLGRLVNPPCRDGSGATTQPASPSEPCPAGSERAHPPVTDLHVGVLTSSLGGHGADACSPASSNFNPTQNDAGRLIARGPSGVVPTYEGLGFLAWDPAQAQSPPGTEDRSVLTTGLQSLVLGAGDQGCGYESTLEAWYRFLVDPAPYEQIVRVPCFSGDSSNGCAEPTGVDATLMAQRAAFLRPDSLLSIVVLSDENDCSIVDGAQNFIVAQITQGASAFHLPRATSACASDPGSPCCRSCGQAPEPGCPPMQTDAECQKDGGFYTDASREDPLNLRCWEQKRRFGIDFLQPIDRYTAGLSNLTVEGASGETVPNPIFSGGSTPRSRGLVMYTSIVGVPWQDLVGDPSAPGVTYLTADELASEGRWDVVLGDPTTGTLPADPHMIESVVPRSGTNPVTNTALQPPTATAGADPINGHEYDNVSRDDLQYACIFPLATPRDCNVVFFGCDCTPGFNFETKPLCQDPSTGTYSNVQHFAKAYPGTRHLSVAKGLGERAVVTSICPRNVNDVAASDFGYRPTVDAMLRHMGPILARGQ